MNTFKLEELRMDRTGSEAIRSSVENYCMAPTTTARLIHVALGQPNSCSDMQTTLLAIPLRRADETEVDDGD